jgi:hypothetical protein
MMTKKIKLMAASFLILVASLNSGKVQAQDYKNALGLRGSYGPGITFKHFIKETAALEFIVSPFYYNGLNVTFLYEKHAYAFNTTVIRWFYGGGLHAGVARPDYRDYDHFYPGKYNPNYYYNHGYDPAYDYSRPIFNFGIDGIIGLEYKPTEIPFTFGIDIKPFIDLAYFYPSYFDAAISVRYVFAK